MHTRLRAVAIAAATLPLTACIAPIAASVGGVFPGDDDNGSEIAYSIRMSPAALDMGWGFDIHYRKLNLPGAAPDSGELEPVLLGNAWFLRVAGPVYALAGIDIGLEEATWGWEGGLGAELALRGRGGLPFGSLFAEGCLGVAVARGRSRRRDAVAAGGARRRIRNVVSGAAVAGAPLAPRAPRGRPRRSARGRTRDGRSAAR